MVGRTLVLFGFLGFGLAAVACLDDASAIPDDLPYLGAQSACSTGPAYTDDAKFSAGPSSSDERVCVSRCGTHPTLTWGLTTGTSTGSAPALEAVPSGACQYADEACSMVAVRRCCGGTPGEGLLLECHCVNLTWSCTAGLAPGSISCPASCPAADAGEEEDAGTAGDASSDAGDAGDAGDAASSG